MAAWIDRQAASRPKNGRIIACTATGHFGNASEALQTANAIRLDRRPVDGREEDLVLLLTHALARWLATSDGASKPVQLFISHAKAQQGGVSGRDLALNIKAFIDTHPAGQVFFDEVDIAGGEEFADTLAAALDDATVIILLTDAFSSRFWCGWEVVTSKEKNRPVVVVNALEQGEITSLAYIGKTPTIRWNAHLPKEQANPSMHRRIVALALLEHLRLIHDRHNLDAIRRLAFRGDATDVTVAVRPPELATLPEFVPQLTNRIVLHSDPPLPRYELRLIERQRPDLRFASASQALAGCVAWTRPLANTRIAVSISDAPDREARGFSVNAQNRLWNRLAVHLLAAGAALAYGGDLRVGGYTDQLLDLARSLADAGRPLPQRIVHWYAGWPISACLSTQMKAALPSAFVLYEGDSPKIVPPPDPSWPPQDGDPEHHYAWTIGMTDMRCAMARACHARILVGGQFRGVAPWPGLLEEFETSVGKPLFLIGAFGGATRKIIDVLHGEAPPEFTSAYQDDAGRRTAVREHYENRHGAIDWAGRVQRIQNLGTRGLNNGLSDEENERLFATRNVTEMIALVLKGLREKVGSA